MVGEGDFRALDLIRKRKQDYSLAFQQPCMHGLLEDLAKFCRANETTGVLDKNGRLDEAQARQLEGRREVWLRIQQHLQLTPTQLFQLYTGRIIRTEGEDNG